MVQRLQYANFSLDLLQVLLIDAGFVDDFYRYLKIIYIAKLAKSISPSKDITSLNVVEASF